MSDRIPDQPEPSVGDDHERFAADVAGYVLGGLTVAEQHAFEAHLATCDTCRQELDELDPIPALLDLAATPTPALGPTPAPAPAPSGAPGADVIVLTAPDAVLAESAAEPVPTRRVTGRRGLLAGAAVSVLGLAAAFLIGLMVAAPSDAGYSQAVALHPATTTDGAKPAPSASGTVAVRTVDHGTEVRLAVSGLPASAGTYYECLWWSADGVRSAGTFRVTGSGASDVDLTTAAELHPGWKLAILEHPGGRRAPVTVLETSA